MARIDPNKLALEERVVQINRVAKVVKGGRRFSFSAVVVVGDGAGHVGVGIGKAGEVPESIRKGVEDAKKNLIKIPMVGTTIPHEVQVVYGASSVLLKPASQGTGVIAGGSVRAVLESAGVRDILSKIHGSTNPVNVTRATIEALRSLHSAEELGARRGVKLVSRIAGQPAPVAARGRCPVAAKLKVTQVKSTISHIARNRATVRALGLHGIGSTSIITDNPATRGMVRQVRFLVTVEEIDVETGRPGGEGMKLHDLQPAEGSRKPRTRVGRGIAAGKGKTAGRGTKGQKARAGGGIPRLVRGRPDAAPHAHPEAARLQEPVQDRVRGRQHRGDRRARRARRVRSSRTTARRRRSRRRSPSTRTSCARSGSSGRSTSRSRSSARARSRPPLFVVADAFTASARAKIEAAGGCVNVLEVPKTPLAALGVTPRSAERRRRPRPSRSPKPRPQPTSRPKAPKAGQAAKAEAAPSRRRGRPTRPSRGRATADADRRATPTPSAATTPHADASADTADDRRRRARPQPTRPSRPPATTPDPCSNPSSTRSARRISGAGSCMSWAC